MTCLKSHSRVVTEKGLEPGPRQAYTGPRSFGLFPATKSQVSEIFVVLFPLSLTFLLSKVHPRER